MTASRGDLDALYAEKGVKGYERPRAAGAKQYAPKGARGSAAAPALPDSALREKIDRAAEAAVSRPAIRQEKAEPQALAEAFKPVENAAVSVLRDGAESGIIETGTWYERNIAGNPEMEESIRRRWRGQR